MGLYNEILECLGLSSNPHSKVNFDAISDKKSFLTSSATDATEAQTAETLISAILSAEKLGQDLQARLQKIVSESGLVHHNGLWYEGLAKILLQRFEVLIQEDHATKFTGAIKEAYDKANGIVQEFVHEHPILTAVVVTLVVLGLLMYAAPWAVHALGFTLDGPLEGSFAAAWQSQLGNVEARSWFAFWQRLGMTWGK